MLLQYPDDIISREPLSFQLLCQILERANSAVERWNGDAALHLRAMAMVLIAVGVHLLENPALSVILSQLGDRLVTDELDELFETSLVPLDGAGAQAPPPPCPAGTTVKLH
jgi:hypothetical protein